MINNNVFWVETSSLQFNPLWINQSIINNWKYSCLTTEVAVYGILSPIMVTRDNVVIDGNTRLKIALDLGIKKVPVIVYQDDTMSDLITNKIKPSSLVKILKILDSKYGLNSSTRFNKRSFPKVLISLRKLIIGGNKRLSQIYQLDDYSNKVRKLYPFETNEIWEQLDCFTISLEEGIIRMKDLFERKSTVNFSLEYKMVA